MSSNRKYKCPWCEDHFTREDLIQHIDEEHRDFIPEGWTPARTVFKIVNGKDRGTCVVCKKETKWNEDRGKYNRICDNPKCKKALRDAALKNHIKVYGKSTLLNDMAHQNKMLSHRKISGQYRFSTGGKIGFVGTYEKNFLEFMDKVLKFKSDEIIEPGPVIEYEYKDEKKKWITDFYIPCYNLVIDVKDGGDNPNNRPMDDYRHKQDAKEKAITKLGSYNYLRLTNNNFSQLLEIFAELKLQMIDDTNANKKAVIKIYEDTEEEDDEYLPDLSQFPTIEDVDLSILYDDDEEVLEEDGNDIPEVKNFKEFCQKIKDPRQALKWFIFNKIRWPHGDEDVDRPIHWPDKLIATKMGNCWDQSVFMHYYLKAKHIEHRVFYMTWTIVGTSKYAGHIIPLYQKGKYVYAWLYTSPGNGIISGPYKDWYEAGHVAAEYLQALGVNMGFGKPTVVDDSLGDPKEFEYLDKWYDKDITQERYIDMNNGMHIRSSHFYSYNIRGFHIPTFKTFVGDAVMIARKVTGFKILDKFHLYVGDIEESTEPAKEELSTLGENSIIGYKINKDTNEYEPIKKEDN